MIKKPKEEFISWHIKVCEIQISVFRILLEHSHIHLFIIIYGRFCIARAKFNRDYITCVDQRKAMPKKAQTTAQLHSSHTQVK